MQKLVFLGLALIVAPTLFAQKFVRNFNGVTEMVAVGNRIFLSASTSESGSELWVTEGSGQTTRLMKDCNTNYYTYPGPGSYPSSGNPRLLTEFHNQLYFVATTAEYQYTLFRADGTSTGIAQAMPSGAYYGMSAMAATDDYMGNFVAFHLIKATDDAGSSVVKRVVKS